MSTNNTGQDNDSYNTDFPDLLASEELAANLIQCAVLVKNGEKGPLIRQTIHDLTFYLTGKRVSVGTNHHKSSISSSYEVPPPQSSPSSALSKQHSHASLTGVLGKMVGGLTLHSHGHADDRSASSSSVQQHHHRSEAQKAATSAKNAERARAELSGLGFATTAAQEWCEVHSTMGCQLCNKNNHHGKPAAVTKTASPSMGIKPPFQRPSNPSSALLANGWIEQQRRSKFRTVWKEVLASLVEGRKPGEETTLWVQREVTNAHTGKIELEALHQIPVKWLQTIQYSNQSNDHRFVLKVYNLHEEFVFRCERSQEAAQNWVLTLRSMQEIARLKADKIKAAPTFVNLPTRQLEDEQFPKHNHSLSFEDEKKAPDHASPHRGVVAQATPQAAHAIAAQLQHASAQPSHQQAVAASQQQQAAAAQQQAAAAQAAAAAAQHQAALSSQHQQQQQPSGVQRMSVKELRAIAHGAGITTHGMERGELEHMVQQISAAASGAVRPSPAAGATAPPPPPPSTNNSPSPPSSAQNVSSGSDALAEEEARRNKQAEERHRLEEEAARRSKVAKEEARNRNAAEEAARSRTAEALRKAEGERRKSILEPMIRQQQEAEKQKKAEEERQRLESDRRMREEEEQHRRIAEMQATEQRRRQEEQQRQQQVLRQQQEAEKQKKAEEERQRLEAERRRREEEEHHRRVAELQATEQRRRQEEQQRQQQAQWQQQQQNWRKQQEEDEQRRRAEETRIAEEKRRQEEAYRAQQWQQQKQTAGVPPQQWQQQPMPPNFQHPQYGPNPPPFAPGQAPRPGAGHPPPPPTGNSPVNMKYAKMAAQTNDVGQMSLQAIKHGILVEWALQPPAMQILRPIERLITSIHAVFPPKFGVTGHEHFTKWTVVALPEVMTGAQPDDEKLTKVVRKLRFFLHPDKLPRDFSEEQTYICKMLWDIISDAFEDHKKKEEELGWMK